MDKIESKSGSLTMIAFSEGETLDPKTMIETEINNVYATLVTFFKKSKSDIIQLEYRVE